MLGDGRVPLFRAVTGSGVVGRRSSDPARVGLTFQRRTHDLLPGRYSLASMPRHGEEASVTSPMDDALRRTNEAVERYQVPQRMIAIAANGLETMPEQLRRETELYVLVDAVQQIAGQHGGWHDDCATCLGIKNALAVSMASVRAEADLALAQMISE